MALPRPSMYLKSDEGYWNAVRAIAAKEDRSASSVVRAGIKLLVEQKYPEMMKYIKGFPYDPSEIED